MRIIVALIVVLFCCGLAGAGHRAQVPAQAPQADGASAPAQQVADDQRLDGLSKPETEQPKADDSWWQKVLRAAPNCKSFTDGCRVCSHTVCSNIGIACQPKEWTCNDAETEAKPETKPEEKRETKPETAPDAEPRSK
jgi:hypothetical protein